MPSPVPTLCIRKSRKGWLFLLRGAGGRVTAPPLISVPAAAVVIVRTWQMEQPTWSKRFEPVMASEVLAMAVSRGGALVERMKAAKALMSSSGSSPQLTLALLAHGWLSERWSKAATELPSEEFSTRLKRFVMPCSLRYASEEKESRLAC